MGKRSSFDRRPNDFYATPRQALRPLLPWLKEGTRYIEPCAGKGDLISHLKSAGHTCVGAFDIDPQHPSVVKADARQIESVDRTKVDCFITNFPWSRPMLHPLIEHCSNLLPTWTLLDAGWWHTDQAEPFHCRTRMIVTVGRVKWIAGSKHNGKDDCCWYLFDFADPDALTISIGKKYRGPIRAHGQ